MAFKISFHRVAYITLGVVILGLGFKTYLLEKIVNKMEDNAYVLSPDLKARYSYDNNVLKIYKRDERGNTVVKKKYIPPEGGVDVKVSTPTASGDTDVVFKIKNKGFTVRPGFGALYEGDLLVTLDTKLAYWSRASIGAGLTTRSLNLWASYHLDWIPIWHPQNLEATIGKSMLRFDDKDNRWHLGFRVNF
jgi:hypothetical protein